MICVLAGPFFTHIYVHTLYLHFFLCVGAGTVTFTDEERLYDVLVCFVNSPFSFYVQIRDDEQVSHVTQMAELSWYMCIHVAEMVKG